MDSPLQTHGKGNTWAYTQFSNHMNNMVEAIVITQKEQLHGQVGTKPHITEPLDLPS